MICNHIFFSSKKVDQSFAKSIEQTFNFIIAPSRIEIDFGCVLQKFHLSALWWLRRQDVWSALLTEILKYLVKVLTRTILVVKPGQHRVDDDCFPICLIGQIGCSRSSAPFVCEIIRPHHPSRTQNPDTSSQNHPKIIPIIIQSSQNPASSSQQDPKSGHNAWIESQFNVSTPSFWAKSAKCTRTWYT